MSSEYPRQHCCTQTSLYVKRKANQDFDRSFKCLKGVFAKNERGYRLNAIKKRF